jgi:hypothetical protein
MRREGLGDKLMSRNPTGSLFSQNNIHNMTTMVRHKMRVFFIFSFFPAKKILPSVRKNSMAASTMVSHCRQFTIFGFLLVALVGSHKKS